MNIIEETNQILDLIEHLKDYLLYALTFLGIPPIKIVKPPTLEKEIKKKRKRKHHKRKKR